MKKCILILAFTVISLFFFASCSQENTMEQLVENKSKAVAPYLVVENNQQSGLNIQMASMKMEEPVVNMEKKLIDDKYCLTVEAPEVKVNFPSSKIEKLELTWYINGVKMDGSDNGSITAFFKTPGYREINCIAHLTMTDGGVLSASHVTTVVQYPL